MAAAGALAAPGQLNLTESPYWGSRSVDCFEKLEQIGEGTYGSVQFINLLFFFLSLKVGSFLVILNSTKRFFLLACGCGFSIGSGNLTSWVCKCLEKEIFFFFGVVGYRSLALWFTGIYRY
ncbi:hypothetical protein OIU74_023638 [Salix koriyanagi]|uniref:Uncharacterized protein n=1 Tax=Salix koriyanagi TaxID=2511006 RepID=A0A9Q1AB14_9ROSI|nr:hypothetical protein OIU74_023638 [Salix koriyanagi]